VTLRIAAVVLMLCAAPPALGANPRSFVASYGNDANSCQLAAPCRSFTAALAATVTGGEIIVLDSAGYGPVNIGKAVSIVSPPGVHAGISVTSGNGIDVQAGSGDVVLRGLTINGVAGSSVGINVASASTVNIDRCSVTGMGSHGLQFQPPTSLVVSDTLFRHNAGQGILQISGNAVYVRVRSEQNTGAGLNASGQTSQTYDSVFAQNGGGGVVGAQAVLLSSTQVLGNTGDGVAVTPFGPLSIVGSVIEGNTNRGVYVAGGHTTLTRTAILRNSFEGVNGSGGGASIVFDGTTIGQNGAGAIAVGGGISAITRQNNSVSGTVTGSLTGSPLI
jgi:hypothetical protein